MFLLCLRAVERWCVLAHKNNNNSDLARGARGLVFGSGVTAVVLKFEGRMEVIRGEVDKVWNLYRFRPGSEFDGEYITSMWLDPEKTAEEIAADLLDSPPAPKPDSGFDVVYWTSVDDGVGGTVSRPIPNRRPRRINGGVY